MKNISMQEFSDKCREVNKSNSLFADCIEVILKNEAEPKDKDHYYKIWLKMNLNLIYNENLILQIFDCGVNCGPETAIKMIQKIVIEKPNGEIDCETEIAINDFPEDLVDLYKQERKKYYFNEVRKNPDLACQLKSKMERVEKTKFA